MFGAVEKMAQPREADATGKGKTRRTRQQRGRVMPLIEVKLIKNVFSPEQKREMIERLTDAMVEIEGENMRPVTWVTVQEVASGDWGIGGNALTTEDVHALQSGVAV
jgi:4-oxalocrotonate tautomerase